MISLSYGILWIRARAYLPISLCWEKYNYPLHWNSNTDDNGRSDQSKRSVTALRQAHSEYPHCTAPLSTSTGFQDRLLHLFILLSTFLSLPSVLYQLGPQESHCAECRQRQDQKKEVERLFFFLLTATKAIRKK